MLILAYSILLTRWFSLLPLLDDFLLQIRLFDFRLDTRRMLAGEHLVYSIKKSLEGICMFGHHEPAQATVLYAQEDVTSILDDANHYQIEFVLEVHPPDGQAFRAKATDRFMRHTHYPQVGDIVNVKYHLKSREVELDLKDDIRYSMKRLKYQEQAERQVAQARRDALLAAPPETPYKTKEQ